MSRVVVDHYLERKPLGHLRWPGFRVYRPATPKALAVGLNRYPGSVIGVYAHAGGRVFSFVWGRPANRKPVVYRLPEG